MRESFIKFTNYSQIIQSKFSQPNNSSFGSPSPKKKELVANLVTMPLIALTVYCSLLNDDKFGALHVTYLIGFGFKYFLFQKYD